MIPLVEIPAGETFAPRFTDGELLIVSNRPKYAQLAELAK
jgi:hypothetical protein